MNVFAALTLTENTQEALRAYDAVVLEAAPRTRLTRMENRHVTLAFLGDTPRVEEAASALSHVRAAPFDLLIAGFGTFGRGGRKVLWAGVDKGPLLTACQRAARVVFEEAGFTLPERTFSPHITLARGWDRTGAVDVDAMRAAVSPILQPVDSVALLQTDTEDGHVVYRQLATVALRES